MPKSKSSVSPQDTLPDNFETLGEFWKFWDTHSSADYEDLMEPVDFDVKLESHKTYCAIANEVMEKVRVQARRQGVSSETLINMWLSTHLQIT